MHHRLSFQKDCIRILHAKKPISEVLIVIDSQKMAMWCRESHVQGATYSRKPNAARLDVKIHQVVDHTALEIVLDAVDDNIGSDVGELDIGQILFFVVNRLIDLLVLGNAVQEVFGGHLGILALVVWAGGFDVDDVSHDERLIVADGLDK